MSTNDSQSEKPTKRPLKKGEVVLRDHEYDGIQEYDQKLPNWWLATLHVAIAFFLGYWVSYYQFGIGRDDFERIDAKLAVIDAKKAEELAKMMGTLNDDALWKMSQNQTFVSAGEATFKGTCMACHGDKLQGGIGLPLADAEWKYGGKPMEVLNIVTNGSPDKTKGMIAWAPTLGTKRVVEVVAYVMSHHTPPAGSGGEEAPSSGGS